MQSFREESLNTPADCKYYHLIGRKILKSITDPTTKQNSSRLIVPKKTGGGCGLQISAYDGKLQNTDRTQAPRLPPFSQTTLLLQVIN